MINPNEMDIRVHKGPTVTIAVLTVNDGKYYGEARLHPKDEYMAVIGEWLAASRAFRAYADMLDGLATKLIDGVDSSQIEVPDKNIFEQSISAWKTMSNNFALAADDA